MPSRENASYENATLSHYDNKSKEIARKYESVDMTPFYATMKELVRPNGHIFDIGCGSGRDAAALLHMGFKISATDGSESMIREAVSYHPELRGHIYNCVLPQELPFERNSFDGCIASAILMHFEKKQVPKILKEIVRVLKDNSIFIFSVSSGRQVSADTERFFLELSNEGWEALATRAGFKVVYSDSGVDLLGRSGITWTSFICKLSK